jgi:hypothetical protein
MAKPLWNLADDMAAAEAKAAADARLRALLDFDGSAHHDSRYGDYGSVGGSRMNQRTHDALVVAGHVSGWGTVVFTQGGLNGGAVAASAATHNGLDVADISVTGHSIDEQRDLVAALMLCGAIGFIRGTTADRISDGMVAHLHVVLGGAQHAHPDARAQIYDSRYGYAHGGAGLAGAPGARWWGPTQRPVIEWADSRYNPARGWRP